MFIAILDLQTAPADRPQALACLDGEQPEVRAMEGNLDFRVFASRENDGGLTVLHEWNDREALEAYFASAAFARLGESVRPLAVAAPLSRRFDARLVEAVR